MISAAILLDSISPLGIRLTTFQLRYPKFIHGELMTHRVFSRNASSSRAVPVSKSIEEVRSDLLRARPVFWGKNQRGMQAREELAEEELEKALRIWKYAALDAADHAERMMELGAHKQIVNRVLEPFLHINVVVSATEYMNFFGLRLDADAQPEMRALASLMFSAYRSSKPRALAFDEWHLPFILEEEQALDLDTRLRISVARCARVSYQSFETRRQSTVEEDTDLYFKLLAKQPIHASPAEHQAMPDHVDGNGKWANARLHGNFSGWIQFRKTLTGEACAPLPEGYLAGSEIATCDTLSSASSSAAGLTSTAAISKASDSDTGEER